MKTGLVAGCFDPFVHPGMIKGWIQAIEEDQVCDKLIVALHTDPSIERAEKSPPFLSPEERAIMLCAISYVAAIYTYDFEADLVALIKKIKPDIRILGEDYVDKDFTGKGLVPIHYVRRYEEWSGTAFRDRIINKQYWTKE